VSVNGARFRFRGPLRSNKIGFCGFEFACSMLQVVEGFGGASRDRTDDLIVANDALSQLSYSPMVRVSRVFLFYQRSPIRTKNASAYHRVPQCFPFGKTS
jgi:hypothetical protein